MFACRVATVDSLKRRGAPGRDATRLRDADRGIKSPGYRRSIPARRDAQKPSQHRHAAFDP